MNKLSLSLVVLTTLALGASACGGGHHREMTPERAKKMVSWKLDDGLDDIDATDSQRKAVEAAKDRLIDRTFEVRADGEADKEALRAELLKAQPDAEKVHALVDAQVDRWRAVAHEAADEAIALAPSFDAVQRKAIADMWEEHRH